MPRNGSGTYTLPQPAFVSGTKISSSAVNSDFSDVASAMTQSVSADGQTPLTGPLKMPNGTSGSPGITFVGDTTSGFFLNAAGQVGIALSGVQETLMTPGGTTWSNAQTFNGSVVFGGTTMTIDPTSFTWGPGAIAAFINSLAMEIDVTAFIDGGGSVITNSTPNPIIWVPIPCALTINSWSLMADQSGTITIDILRTNAGFPSSSIVGAGTKPSLSSAQTNLNQAPSSWTATTLAKDDYIGFVTSSAATLQKLNISLRCTRTAA